MPTVLNNTCDRKGINVWHLRLSYLIFNNLLRTHVSETLVFHSSFKHDSYIRSALTYAGHNVSSKSYKNVLLQYAEIFHNSFHRPRSRKQCILFALRNGFLKLSDRLSLYPKMYPSSDKSN